MAGPRFPVCLGAATARCCLALLVLLTGCQSTPSLEYRVALRGPTDPIEITLKIQHVAGRPGLLLRGFAPREAMRIDSLEVRGPHGSALEAVARSRAVRSGGSTLDYPLYRIGGPCPSTIVVRYLVSPGRRQGDTHMGFTGVRLGFQSEAFAFASGRELFLMPEPFEGIRSIRVRFGLPEGRVAVTPWRQDGDGWTPGLGGKYAAEDLISAAVAIGVFRETSREIEGTRYRFFVPASTPDDEARRSVKSMERAARYLARGLGRPIGPAYVVLALPEAPDGDEIAGEAWAGGQGSTLVPITPHRLQRFARSLADARLRYQPFRARFRSPEDLWLVDGIGELYSWRAVAEAGLLTRDDVERSMALEYVNARQDGAPRNLEGLYASAGDPRLGREKVAPYVLAFLDREIRRRTGNRLDLDRLLSNALRKREAPSLWSLLPGGPREWQPFRDQYVLGAAELPVDRVYPLRNVTPSPDPSPGPPRRELALAYTGNEYGYLETCGCKRNQMGGVARRATVLDRVRKEEPLLLLDAGNSFTSPEKRDALTFLAQREQRVFLETSVLARYDALAIGPSELANGLQHFRSMTAGLPLPYVCANVRDRGAPLAPATVVRRVGDLSIAIVGLVEPPRGPAASPRFEDRTVGLEFEDPAQACRREMAKVRSVADLVIAVGRISPHGIRDIAAACPDLDAIVSSESHAPIPSAGEGSDLATEDVSGFLGRTLVLYTSTNQYGVGLAKLGLSPSRRIASARIVNYWLTPEVPDHPHVRRLLNGFYDRVGGMDSAQASVHAPFSGDSARQRGRYAGAAACEKCHGSEFRQWKSTQHANAYKTLLDAHRHYQPVCVSCHVVAYGAAWGYHVGDPEEPLGNVQCEVCHGPGAEHALAPVRVRMSREVPEAVCAQCHTPDHSDHFVYGEKLPRVRHTSGTDRVANGAP